MGCLELVDQLKSFVPVVPLDKKVKATTDEHLAFIPIQGQDLLAEERAE